MKLFDATTDVLFRLDDDATEVWERDEIDLYVRDGYDQFARRTKCIFDIHVIPNVPPVGNWGDDLAKYLAEQKAGMGLTDDPMHRSGGDSERNLHGGNLAAATPSTSPSEASYFDDFSLPTTRATGRLPDGTVDVLRVAWNSITLTATNSHQLRLMDPNFETTSGDPRFWSWDKDGINYIRVFPAAGGDASYATIDGARGSQKYTDDTTVTVYGTRGILREREGSFPAGGRRGTPRRRHPVARNIVVEIARLGRNPAVWDFEIPQSFNKYVLFYAMAKALKRDGPGQDVKLASHYEDRFEVGVQRMLKRLARINSSRVGQFGTTSDARSFGLGDPQLPYNYGANRPLRGGY
jgi:hypothetical protein